MVIETEQHLHRLCVEIGPRPFGSDANHAAADYVFRTAGLAVDVQRFPCPDWTHEETILTLGTEHLPAAANALSLPCDVTAPTVAVGLCDTEYVRVNGDSLGSILAAINLDTVGQRLGANTITMLAHSDAFRAAVGTVTDRYPGVLWVDPWPQSNHFTFASRGVPSIALSSHFAGVTAINHQPTDTLDWLSPDKLREVVALVTEIVRLLAAKPLAWTRA